MKVVALCLLGIGVNTLLFGPSLKLTATGINDFMSMYSGARLAFTGDMYDVEKNLKVQRETAGWENPNRLFLRPPFDALIMWPLGRLPFRQATIVWEALIVLMVALFCYLWPGDRGIAALVCCWSYPIFDVFADGQDIMILLLLIVMAMREMRQGRELTAGVLISVCSIKVHLFLLIPVLIARNRLWRFAAGLAAGGMLLFLISYAPAGPGWPGKLAAVLRDPISNPWPDAMPTIHGLTSGLAHEAVWQTIGTLAVVVLVWFATNRGGFEYGLAAVLTGGILVAPHAYMSDIAIAVPAFLITLPLAKVAWQRHFHLFLLSPFLAIGTLLHATAITTIGLILYLAVLALGVGRKNTIPLQ